MPGVIRKICDPPIADICDVPMLSVQSERQFTTKSSAEVMKKFISPSFTPILSELIPHSTASLGFGGGWFWSCYLHALHGEDIFIDIVGTGVSLSEDPLNAQVLLRQRSSLGGKNSANEIALEHCSSKLETLCAVCVSVVLHVAQQPMLEDGEGPQALVLCATKDQCDEVYALMDRFGAALHLVTHNLFGAYPPMPVGRRADIVIGTPPLWESVASLKSSSTHTGLEEILNHISQGSRWATSSTRWRPYSLNFVAQFVLVDLDLQYALGYLPTLKRLFMSKKTPGLPVANSSSLQQNQGNPPTYSQMGLPRDCQMYCVLNGLDTSRELFSTLRTLRNDPTYPGSMFGLACIGLRLESVNQNDFIDGVQVCSSRKRTRDCDGPTCGGSQVGNEQHYLIIHDALSHSRLLADLNAFGELVVEVERRANAFFARFEVLPETDSKVDSVASMSSEAVIDVRLAFVCRPAGESSAVGAEMWLVRETVAVVRPVNAGAVHSSRAALLMQHLEDELSGQIFDGSVVRCLHCCFSLNEVARNSVLNHDIFTATAMALSQEPLFLDLEGCAAGAKIRNEAPEHLAHLRDVAVQTSRRSSDKGCFPLHKFLSQAPCQSGRSVIVFRCIAPSVPALCEGADAAKPIALLYLEECCQYGKVISYFVYEQPGAGDDGDKRVHFFVEFETAEGATEAVRQFSLRLANEPQFGERAVRVKLFSNSLYYEGAAAQLRLQFCEHETLCGPTSGPVLSDDDDDLMNISLLAE
ncbi:hypothetical protein ERJ75_000834100 [Trypanosoma vivax]|nr:hypothetical protein TRVL_06567 [Trypanosoma vivax]KAH8613064.1 hypothetical protein ERJ75_000834100 [Trypanosoma vivax]